MYSKEIVNLRMYHVELKNEILILHGTRGNDKHYQIKIKLDQDWKASCIAEHCILHFRRIANNATKCLVVIKSFIKSD